MFLFYSNRQAHAEPVTPSKIPTASIYDQHFLQTPTFEAGFCGSGLSWLSPDPCSSDSRHLRALQAPSRPNQVGAQERLSKDAINAQLAAHVHHSYSNPALSLPPVEQSRLLSSSPCSVGVCTSPNENNLRKSLAARSNPTSVIQTPPSSGFKNKRLSHQTMASIRRNSASKASNMGPPETPSRVMQASPQLFPALQFSPDLFQPQFSGPATAPAYPQQRLFWDTDLQPNSGVDAISHFQEPFGHSQTDLVSPFAPSPAMSHGFDNTNNPQDTYDLPSSQGSHSVAHTSPFFDNNAFPAPFTASPRVPPPKAEDPSMFLSSPARRFGPLPQSSSMNSNVRIERQPYHHQVEESKREEEAKKAKAEAQRFSGSSQSNNPLRRPASPTFEARPGLKRSSTHSGVRNNSAHGRQQSQVSFAESVSVANGEAKRLSRGGRSSPLKRMSRSSFTSMSDRPPSRQRTSLTFTIDKDGRAKTVVTTVPEKTNSYMDLDDDSSESEAESTDMADFDTIRSQNNSFAFPDEEPVRHTVPSRLAAQSHSKNSSYSSTITSSNSAYQSSRTSSNPGGARPKTSRADTQVRPANLQQHQPRQQVPLPNTSAQSFLEEASDEDHGDAQHALRAALRDRRRPSSAQFGKQRANPSPQFHSSPPIQQGQYAVYNVSPTTITDPDLATPSTDRESFASDGSTRCICNSPSSAGRFMIQW